ncbi:NAD-dependent epimerase/dehydratase family protein [Microbispora bryophytorum]|uniref:NAD-dependent epimerase n=1 Tax=Microbispora bryophytorum TaxID=1460882 RepID=A0A8H9GYE3_9ACTN|nr:NAD-dependent epimerase/dehydratase family protein [Microbispora bryophytorum]MBD3138698.1 NAD-dependent epimerase/dehydratase family protein [Microbispora bryophytorum]TQS03720.1 NAD-dependent epimerase/dehydratase family protein [Microbispora bryophytorum]GGO02139.1 NAD-dependent epimerase [Microbispora bryophytorum]
MRVVVIGASGNVGTSVLAALESEPSVTSIVGVARRMPSRQLAKTEWRTADVFRDDLDPILADADAVVHLAWLFQPTHDPVTTWNSNVLGSKRVFDAAVRAGVSVLVHSSSVGAYSPGPKDPPVDESWPTNGWPNAAYGREKAYVERMLDIFERDHPDIRVVRMRPGFIFKEEAATEQRRLFAGPFLPRRLMRPGLIPFVPDMPRLRFQALHSRDAGEAFRLALTRDVRGAFNIAADPVIDPAVLADLLGARLVPVPAAVVRTAVSAGWHLRLIPASPGMVEMVLQIPIMDTTRARRELGWQPRHSAVDALRAVIEGMRRGAGMETPPLAPDSSRRRIKEVTTGVGTRP